jgi:hypothetical protein
LFVLFEYNVPILNVLKQLKQVTSWRTNLECVEATEAGHKLAWRLSSIAEILVKKKNCCQSPAHTHLATRPHAQKKLLSATRPHPLSAARPQPQGKKINLHLIISSYTHNYTQKKTVTNPKPPPPNHPPNPALNVEDYG